jgi:antirestriction protein ArdC
MEVTEQIIREYNQLDGKQISVDKLKEFYHKVQRVLSEGANGHTVHLQDISSRLVKGIFEVNGESEVEVFVTPIKVEKPREKVMIVDDREALTKEMLHGLECLPLEEYDLEEAEGLGFTRDGQAKIYDMITGMILKAMKETKGLPWKKPWKIESILATNLKTKTVYKGVNLFLLNLIAPMLYGKVGPYWLTFKQVKDLGGKVKAGASAFPVIYYSNYFAVSKPERKTITKEQFDSMTKLEKKNRGAVELWTINYYNVFAQEDIDGITFPVHAVKREGSPIETAEAIVASMPKRPEIIHHTSDNAFYSPSKDHIKLPPLDYFNDDQQYYSTLFHELVHSTGHASRLDRFVDNIKVVGEENEYAYEELIAELGASFLNAQAGTLYFTLKNSSVYLRGWQSKLEDIMASDNKFFLKAAGKAAQATDFILDTKYQANDTEVVKPSKTKKKKKAIAVTTSADSLGEVNQVDQVDSTTVEQMEPAAALPVPSTTNTLDEMPGFEQVAHLDFDEIELEGKYKDDFLRLFIDTIIMIWGLPGHGKTVYLLLFAQYLAEFRNLKVLYLANEEFKRSTLTEKVKEFKIGHKNLKCLPSLEELKKYGLTISDFDAIFFDSVNSMGINLKEFKKLVKDNPGKILIPIIQSTKDGDFRGGQDWEHEVDIAGEIVNRKLIIRKNRLDNDFAEKSEKLLIDEKVKEAKKKILIKEEIKQSTEKKIYR